MSPTEALLSQLDKMVGFVAQDVARAARDRRLPDEAVVRAWIRRLRRAADMLEGRLHGS